MNDAEIDDWVSAKIDSATAAHESAPDSEEHEIVWCAACWADDHQPVPDAVTPRNAPSEPA